MSAMKKLVVLLLLAAASFGFRGVAPRHQYHHHHSQQKALMRMETTSSLSEIATAVAGRGAKELELLSVLSEVRGLPFFSQFSIDMLAGCAYLDEQPDECEFDTCEILPIEPIPKGLLDRDLTERTFELDSWARMDVPSEDYYDLADYPEGYTGYNGSHVWNFVYDKLAFKDESDREGWRSVFDRTVSGVHASVSCHVADGMEDDEMCLEEFERRLGSRPERIENLHFAFALVLCAVAQARPWLGDYDFEIGEESSTAEDARAAVRVLASQDILADPRLNSAATMLRESAAAASECVLATSQDAEWLEETGIWQMRQRSRAMLRAFDCVQCGVCRLHGKVCWLGVATALKVIYNYDTKPLSRTEVASLLVSLEKLASSVRFCFEMSESADAIRLDQQHSQ